MCACSARLRSDLLVACTVSLTKTYSKGKTLKTKLVESLREALDEYDNVFVLRYDNMRAALFKDVRNDWKDSKYELFDTYPKSPPNNTSTLGFS